MEWTLVYHDGPFKGRVEPLKLLLEDAGAEYAVSHENLYGPEGLMDAFRGSAEAAVKDTAPFPVMFPPVLWHRPPGKEEVFVNQTAACLTYLATALGYQPASAAEQARVDQITQNCVDYIGEGRGSFHPVNNKESYSSQKEQADKASLEWSKSRMHIWLQHLEKVVKRSGLERPVAGGASVSCADFMLFHALDATEAQFNTEFYGKAWDAASVPGLKAYKAWMASRPKLQAYLASDRRKPWAGDSMM
ncbi:unnamed protein product [Effrenium voratum]|uniref:GST C-terminal domain-containing protein n=1 Tax=Effrenium voratum TaxID=2562239 RepID=A0AA36NH11_9DINO|nr:unnamed protein product [Effrenium voratum]